MHEQRNPRLAYSLNRSLRLKYIYTRSRQCKWLRSAYNIFRACARYTVPCATRMRICSAPSCQSWKRHCTSLLAVRVSVFAFRYIPVNACAFPLATMKNTVYKTTFCSAPALVYRQTQFTFAQADSRTKQRGVAVACQATFCSCLASYRSVLRRLGERRWTIQLPAIPEVQ